MGSDPPPPSVLGQFLCLLSGAQTDFSDPNLSCLGLHPERLRTSRGTANRPSEISPTHSDVHQAPPGKDSCVKSRSAAFNPPRLPPFNQTHPSSNTGRLDFNPAAKHGITQSLPPPTRSSRSECGLQVTGEGDAWKEQRGSCVYLRCSGRPSSALLSAHPSTVKIFNRKKDGITAVICGPPNLRFPIQNQRKVTWLALNSCSTRRPGLGRGGESAQTFTG